ncbi:MAG: hypothetical protein WBF71_03715 [Microthrixaceae bacterium]
MSATPTDPPTDSPTDLATDDSTDLTGRRAAEFVSALPASSGGADRNGSYARAGMIIMVLGVAVAIVAVILSQTSDNPLDQSTQISLGIAGLAATCFGGVVFIRYSLGGLLRFWLLRILHEQHGNDLQ